jgi:hypothetical protein
LVEGLIAARCLADLGDSRFFLEKLLVARSDYRVIVGYEYS